MFLEYQVLFAKKALINNINNNNNSIFFTKRQVFRTISKQSEIFRFIRSI